MSCDCYNTFPEFKECAGKNCQNPATTQVQVKYIKKIGYFCDSCTLELKALGLVDEGI